MLSWAGFSVNTNEKMNKILKIYDSVKNVLEAMWMSDNANNSQHHLNPVCRYSHLKK